MVFRHIANTAENIFYADKVLIISWVYRWNGRGKLLALQKREDDSSYIKMSERIKNSAAVQEIYCQHRWKQFLYWQVVNNFVSKSVQLHYHRNFQKTHYPEISVQSPGSNRAERPAYDRIWNAIDCVSYRQHPFMAEEKRGQESGSVREKT